MPLIVRYTVSNKGSKAALLSKTYVRAVPQSFEVRTDAGRRVPTTFGMSARPQTVGAIAVPAGESISRQASLLELIRPEAMTTLGRFLLKT